MLVLGRHLAGTDGSIGCRLHSVVSSASCAVIGGSAVLIPEYRAVSDVYRHPPVGQYEGTGGAVRKVTDRVLRHALQT